jgi:CDP-6-deoxy-D-xylo-4-hexulose-3-dehydrase
MMKKDIKSRFFPGKTRIKYGGAVVDKKEITAIQKVLNRNWWTLDEEGIKFEKELAKVTGVKHTLFTNSGSSALLLAISSLQLEAGSEIIIPAVNFPTIVSACMLNNLIPVFVDVDSDNLCLNLDKAKKAITSKTKAIVVVDIAGNTVDLEKLSYFKNKKIITILDNCDGYGTTYKNKFVESYFDIAATSFHAAHIITTGEGGAVFTNNTTYYKTAKSLREWGRADDSDGIKVAKKAGLPDDYPGRYTYITRGFNLKPIELQAAMGRVQLKKLQRIKIARAKNYKLLSKGIESIPFLKASVPPENASISWFSFPVTVKKPHLRGKLRKFLEENNIETRVIFAGNIVKQPAYQKGNYKVSGSLENSDTVLNDSFFVSVHPTITHEMIDFIINCLKKFFSSAS